MAFPALNDSTGVEFCRGPPAQSRAHQGLQVLLGHIGSQGEWDQMKSRLQHKKGQRAACSGRVRGLQT